MAEKKRILSKLNEFLYQTYPGIGVTKALDDEEFDYFSDFHKFWEQHHEEILGMKAVEERCREVAVVIDKIYNSQGGKLLGIPFETKNITPDQIAQARFLTANQDFRESIPKNIYDKIVEHPEGFDEHRVSSNPESFLSLIGVTNLSQTDKRIDFARNAANYLIDEGINAFKLAETNGNDAVRVSEALQEEHGIGYKKKKADMFIRDMYALKVWPDLINIDKIDVASDRNTMRVALRLGILSSEIPLLSSLLDIFSYQYGLVDEKSAAAWRRVWEEWKNVSPDACPESPAMMDYLLYRTGQTCFNDLVYEYHCTKHAYHIFYRSSKQTKLCPKCRARAVPGDGVLTALADTHETEVSSCPLDIKCKGHCHWNGLASQDPGKAKLEPPKSISILGRTGWESARTTKEQGAGGLMS